MVIGIKAWNVETAVAILDNRNSKSYNEISENVLSIFKNFFAFASFRFITSC